MQSQTQETETLTKKLLNEILSFFDKNKKYVSGIGAVFTLTLAGLVWLHGFLMQQRLDPIMTVS